MCRAYTNRGVGVATGNSVMFQISSWTFVMFQGVSILWCFKLDSLRLMSLPVSLPCRKALRRGVATFTAENSSVNGSSHVWSFLRPCVRSISWI